VRRKANLCVGWPVPIRLTDEPGKSSLQVSDMFGILIGCEREDGEGTDDENGPDDQGGRHHRRGVTHSGRNLASENHDDDYHAEQRWRGKEWHSSLEDLYETSRGDEQILLNVEIVAPRS